MAITITGENSYALHDALKTILTDFTATHGDIAIERLDGEDVDYERLVEAITSLPFLSARKLVVLYSPSKNKEFIEKVKELLLEVSETTDVVLVESKLDKRSAYYKYLKAHTEYREFNVMDQNGLAQWLLQTVKDAGGAITIADAHYLVDRVGTNQQLAYNELEKLLLYNSHITLDTINLLTEERPQSTIFQLLEAAFAGNKRRALALYTEQRFMKVEPLQIIAMLTWQLHILALIVAARNSSPDEIARDTKINPYVIRKSSAIARRLSLKTLRLLIARLLEIDLRLKSESINPDEVLKNYLLLLSNM
jgi:DNA polymerase-3 subunit delta